MKIVCEEERLRIAKTIACLAHANQKDKAGEIYPGHLLRVANQCKSISAKIVAWLHDVVEDKHMTHHDLEALGVFTGHELYCIRLLDKSNYERLSLFAPVDYYERIKEVPIAREVKIADLRDNMDPNRFIRNNIELTDKDRERLKKYADKLAYLEE